MPAGVEIRGARQLARALRRAGVEVKDMKDANQRVSDVVVHASQPITPHRTGRLAGSIRSARMQSGASVRAGGGAVKYARYVEYGTGRMSARPYLTTGMQQSQPQWMDVYLDELQRLMDKVAAASPGTGD